MRAEIDLILESLRAIGCSASTMSLIGTKSEATIRFRSNFSLVRWRKIDDFGEHPLCCFVRRKKSASQSSPASLKLAMKNCAEIRRRGDHT